MMLTPLEADNLVADATLMRVLAADPREGEAYMAVFRRFCERVLRVASCPAGAPYRCDEGATGLLSSMGV